LPGGAGGVIGPAAGGQAAPGPAAVCMWPAQPLAQVARVLAAPVAPGLACPRAQARPWVRSMRAATSAGDARAAGLRRAARAARRCAAPSRRDGSLVPGCGGELTGEFPPGAVAGLAAPPGRTGFTLGLAMAVNQVTNILMPPVLGLLKDLTHSFAPDWGPFPQ
jgi:hypothetical protein